MYTTKFVGLWAIIALSAAGIPAYAGDIVPVLNGGFELSTEFSGSCCSPLQLWNDGSIPNWTVAGLGGDYRPTPNGETRYISPYEGLNVAFVAGGSISQFLSSMVLPGASYNLSVAVGRSFQFVPETYAIALYAGEIPIITYSGDTGSITPGSWSVIELTGNSGDLSGLPLEIRLSGGGVSGGQVLFDAVNLEDPAPVPEPSTWSIVLLGGLVAVTAGKKLTRRHSC